MLRIKEAVLRKRLSDLFCVVVRENSSFEIVDDTLRQEQRCSTELDYIEQTSWLDWVYQLDLGRNLGKTCLSGVLKTPEDNCIIAA